MRESLGDGGEESGERDRVGEKTNVECFSVQLTSKSN